MPMVTSRPSLGEAEGEVFVEPLPRGGDLLGGAADLDTEAAALGQGLEDERCGEGQRRIGAELLIRGSGDVMSLGRLLAGALVDAQRCGARTRTNVADVPRIEEALQPAALTPPAMKDGEHDIEGNVGLDDMVPRAAQCGGDGRGALEGDIALAIGTAAENQNCHSQ
jgi:hypothetical protein